MNLKMRLAKTSTRRNLLFHGIYIDVKGGTVMKDRNGKLVTEQEAVLEVRDKLLQGVTEPGKK